jgi:MFS family permease
VTSDTPAAARPATYRALFADREFRALFVAQAVSLTGDQVARVALAALVYEQTRSALLTGALYAITYLPWLIGGPLLGGLADRHPRRAVLLVCQVGAGLLVAVMALPGLPLVLVAALLFLVVLAESPYLSARASLLVDVLPDDRYVLASGLNQLAIQATQVAGFALGGWLVLAVGARGALLLDALSFLLAAALVRASVRERPVAAAHGGGEEEGGWGRIRAGAAVVFGDPWLRGLALLAWTAAFWVVPEGLAAPYVDGREADLGLLLAAQPAGAVVGGVLLSRLVTPATRLRLMWPLALLAGLPLLAFAATPALPVAMALLVVSGLGTAYNVPANAAFMQALPPDRRGQAFGLVAAGLVAGQGLAIAAAGAIAEAVRPGHVIAAAGALGVLAVLLLRPRRGGGP